MNDKVKGLVLGLSLGVMLTGSVAYASGSQIEVYFKSLKYMFDGVQKQPTEEQGQGFIYNGTTYVPLRFVSEALGKEVNYDGDTGTIWVGRKVDLSTIVATYQGGQVTQGEFEKYMAIVKLLNPDSENNPDSVLTQMIGYKLLASRATESMKAAVASQVDLQQAQITKYLASTSQSLDKNGLTDADLHAYIAEILSGHQFILSEFNDDTLKAEYDKRLADKTGDFIIASVRHILISNDNVDGTPRTKEEIDKRVKEVQDKLNSGADFAAVAKEYTDDPGSKQNGGLYQDAPLAGFVEPFKKAAIELDLNKISDPVQTEYGYHIMRVEDRKTQTFEEAKQQLLNDMAGKRLNSFMTQDVPALIQNKKLP